MLSVINAPQELTLGSEEIKTEGEEQKPTDEDNESIKRRKRLSVIIEEKWPPFIKKSWPPPPFFSACTIFRAPPNVVQHEQERKSTVAHIGPFGMKRAQSSELQIYKRHCLSYLLARHGSKENTAELLKKCISLVLKLELSACSCYEMDVEERYMFLAKEECSMSFSQKKEECSMSFAEMLLLDGCFILYLLLRQGIDQNQNVDRDLTLELELWEAKLRFWNMVVYDLIKLENQIPFFVLQELFHLLKTPADNNINLVELALELFRNVYPARAKTFVPPHSSEVLHLLHLFHSSLIPPKLLVSSVAAEGAPDWIPSATVLQDAGIEFRSPKKKMAKSFLDVAFENGVMEIPQLEVDKNARMVFSNLIAFEQCYPHTGAHISTYAKFMDYLVNSAGDVRQLSLDGVLLNESGTEEAVADLFNNLRVGVSYIPRENYLSKVLVDANKYFRSSSHKWRTTINKWRTTIHKWHETLLSNYFSNPWTTSSVLAAVILLLLTIIGTVFAGLSYFHELQTD